MWNAVHVCESNVRRSCRYSIGCCPGTWIPALDQRCFRSLLVRMALAQSWGSGSLFWPKRRGDRTLRLPPPLRIGRPGISPPHRRAEWRHRRNQCPWRYAGQLGCLLCDWHDMDYGAAPATLNHTMLPANIMTAERSTYVPKTCRRSCSVHDRPMLATNSVQLAGGGWASVALAATIASDPGDIGFIEPGWLATSGLAVTDGWASAGRALPAAAGATNGADADVNWWWCPGNSAGWNYTHRCIRQ